MQHNWHDNAISPPMEGQLKTQLTMQIFQNTRHDLDLYQEATVYEFPVGLLGLPFDLPKSSENLAPLSDIIAQLRRKLGQQEVSKCKPILVKVQGKDSLGVCLAQPHSFDQKSSSAAVIPMSNPNQAPVRVKIKELKRVC